MPVAGAKPKADRSQVRHRVEPVHEWTEVENVPYAGAPPLRDRATGGVSVMAVGVANSEDWPQATLDWWADVSTMPHAKLWDAAEWRFAMDSAEIHARTMEGWRGYTGPTLLAREKVLGVTADMRRDLRIRYVEPKSADERAVPADVVQLDSYRAL
jgi:hypothetical protein